MIIIHKFAAVVATCALSATILGGEAHAETEDCLAVERVTIQGEDVELLPGAAEQVRMLQAYGTRYTRVIDLILEENAKPDWTFTDYCVTSDAGLLAASE